MFAVGIVGGCLQFCLQRHAKLYRNGFIGISFQVAVFVVVAVVMSQNTHACLVNFFPVV